MKQRVNLYQSELFEKTTPFSGRTGGALLLAAAGILVLFGSLGEWRHRQLASRLEELNRRQAALQAELAVVREKTAAGRPLLETELGQLRGERDRRRDLLALLQSRPAAAANGFSPYLVGLARQTVPGVWLRRIVLREGGGEIRLEGSATRPEAVPRLIRQLDAEPAFKGLEFAQFLLARGEPEREIDFRLETAAEKEGSDERLR